MSSWCTKYSSVFAAFSTGGMLSGDQRGGPPADALDQSGEVLVAQPPRRPGGQPFQRGHQDAGGAERVALAHEQVHDEVACTVQSPQRVGASSPAWRAVLHNAARSVRDIDSMGRC